LSAISAIYDSDRAVKPLQKKWSIIQNHQSTNPYVLFPVLGLSNGELKSEVTISIPRLHFAIFLLLGWVSALIVLVATKAGVRESTNERLWYFVITVSVLFTAGFLFKLT